MCNFNFNRICQNISRTAGVVSPATFPGTRQPQNSHASHPHLPCTHASTAWQHLDGSRLGSGGFMFTSGSSFLGPGFRAHCCLGTLLSGILIGETEGRERLFNRTVTPDHRPLARGHTRPGPTSVASYHTPCCQWHFFFQCDKGKINPLPLQLSFSAC